jgi:hypothetical protein
VDTRLWALFHQIQASYCEAFNQFGDKLIDDLTKAEKADRYDIYDIIWVGNLPGSRTYSPARKDTARDLYKKYPQIWNKHFKPAHVNLVQALPHIKKLWVDAIKEWESMPEGQVKQSHKKRIDNYRKNMKVNNVKLAKDIIDMQGFIKGYGRPSEDDYEENQTYSYCMVDYG